MTTQSLGVAVLGTGAAASAHIDNWQDVEGASVVAVGSRDRARAQAKLDAHGLADASAYGDYGALLADSRVQVVSICTPHFQHPDEAIAAAEAGKHLVIEKPVALNEADLDRVARCVEQHGVLTSVCFELHWIGSFLNTRAMIERGDIGEPFYAEAAYNHGIKRDNPQFAWGHARKNCAGSAFLTAGCHALDAVLHLLNDRVRDVCAFGCTSHGNHEGYEYPPNVVAILRMTSGRVGKASVSLESENPYHFPVVVQGDQGSIVDQYYYSAKLPAIHGWNELATDVPASGDPANHPYRGQFQHFKRCIERNETPENDLTAAAHVHDVCFAINASLESGGQPVSVR